MARPLAPLNEAERRHSACNRHLSRSGLVVAGSGVGFPPAVGSRNKPNSRLEDGVDGVDGGCGDDHGAVDGDGFLCLGWQAVGENKGKEGRTVAQRRTSGRGQLMGP